MNQKERLDLYKELYFFEWQRKELIAGGVGALPATLTFILSGAVVYYLNNLPAGSGVSSVVFWVTFVVGSACLLVSCVCFAMVMLRAERAYLAPYDEIEKYHRKLEEYNDASSTGQKNVVDQKFERTLLDQFCHCAAKNHRLNNRKAGLKGIGISFLLGSLVFLVASFRQVADSVQ